MALNDAPRKPKSPERPAPKESEVPQRDVVPVRQVANRILPSLLSEEAEQSRIAQEIEAYKARWRAPKPADRDPEGQPKVRKGRSRPVPEAVEPRQSVPAAGEHLAPSLMPERKQEGRRQVPRRVSLHRSRERTVSQLRRGERWKRRLPKACW